MKRPRLPGRSRDTEADGTAKQVVAGLKRAQRKARRRAFWAAVGKRLRDHLVAGILVVVPIGATILILKWLFESVDSILQPIIRTFLGRPVYGLGFAITLLIVYLSGLAVTQFGGRRLVQFVDSVFSRVPVVRPMYYGIKQILESFAAPRETGFMQVVLVEFPRKGVRSLGFITNEEYDATGQKLLNIFIPTAPNPTSGFLQIMREEEVQRTDIPVDDALKMIVSAGRISLKKVNARISGNHNDVVSGRDEEVARRRVVNRL
jgi:uncharacterized membrane protein